jgi:serine protease Do
MYRTLLPLSSAIVLTWSASAARAVDPPVPREVEAIQEAFQKAIAAGEPAIACILVSRSEAYRTLGSAPPDDRPDQLGSYDPDKVMTRIPRADQGRVGPTVKKLDLADPANVPEAYGSGVVLDAKQALVLTNYHVIQDAMKVYVRLPGGKGSYADIHAADPRSDLAVLRLLDPPAGLRALRLGDGGNVRKGQLVLALANPYAAGFRDGSPSASWGIIGNVRRRAPSAGKDAREDQLTRTLHHYGTLLQADPRVSLGCSGGALVDLHGELIGLTTSLAAIAGSDTAGGFAVPMDDGMKRVVARLLEGKEVEYGFLGVVPRAGPGPGDGVRIQDPPLPGSPADRAGLRLGDTVLGINGSRIDDVDELFLKIGLAMAGKQVRLDVRSDDGRTRTVTVTLAKFRVPEQLGKAIVSNKPPAVRGLRVDYTSLLIQFAGPFPRMRRQLTPGVLVSEVERGSAADRAGLKPNDVIAQVNGQAVESPPEFYKAVDKARGPLELSLAALPFEPARPPVKLP